MKKNNEPSGLYEKIYEGERRKRVEQAQIEARREEAARRAAARGRRRTVFRVLTTFFLVVVVFVVMFAVIYKLFFRSSELRAEGEVRYDAETIFEVAGVKKGDNLYSFSSRVALEKLKARCPYIKSLTVKREIPDKITFTLEEYEAKYYAFVYGRTCLLSDDLTVVEMREGEDKVDGLCFLALPAVREAICGSQLVFRNEIDENHVYRTVDSVLRSDIADRVSAVILSDTYALSMECDHKYLMIFGGYADCDIKLRVASVVLKDDMFKNENKMRIDLTNNSETTVIIDNTLTLH